MINLTIYISSSLWFSTFSKFLLLLLRASLASQKHFLNQRMKKDLMNRSEFQKLGFENVRYYTETPYGGQSSASTSRYYGEDEPYVEITLDIHEDSVSVYGMKSPDHRGAGSIYEDQSLLRQGRSGRSNSVLKRLASSVSTELKRVASSVSSSSARKPPRPQIARLRRSKSRAEQALKGLKFITKTDGVTSWPEVEKRFYVITMTTNGLLHRSKFGECIG